MWKGKVVLADLIEEEAGEPIISARIGPFGWASYDWAEEEEILDQRILTARPFEGQTLPWSEAKPLLSYTWDRGYGAPDCHAVYAWTEHWVVLIGTYDGATGVHKVPRGPDVEATPRMIGGG